MSIVLLNCTETISNLNNSTVATPTTISPDNYAVTDGTYALINQMISNLSSIKASIKTQEKNINAALLTEMRTIESGNPEARTVATSSMVVANRKPHLTGGGAIHDTLHGDNNTNTSSITRYTLDQTTVNKYPAVLTANSNSYTESAVWAVLHEAAIIISSLKNGTYSTGTLGLHGTQIE